MPDNMITINLTLYRELMEDREWLKHLKEVANTVDETHYDFCVKLQQKAAELRQEVAQLKQKLLMRGVN